MKSLPACLPSCSSILGQQDVCVRRPKVFDGAYLSEAISAALDDLVWHTLQYCSDLCYTAVIV